MYCMYMELSPAGVSGPAYCFYLIGLEADRSVSVLGRENS